MLTFEKAVSISVKTILLSHFLTPYNEKIELLFENFDAQRAISILREMVNDRTKRTFEEAEIIKLRAVIIDIC